MGPDAPEIWNECKEGRNMLKGCKDCTERHEHCHTICEKYMDYKMELARINGVRAAEIEKMAFAKESRNRCQCQKDSRLKNANGFSRKRKT